MKTVDGRAWARTNRHLTLPPADGWVRRAACAGHDPDHWYLAERSGNYDYARAVCAGCPVQADCLEWALLAGEWQGLWGGKSPNQRRDLTRRRAS